jgi:hypothetical protein
MKLGAARQLDERSRGRFGGPRYVDHGYGYGYGSAAVVDASNR